MVHIHSNGFFYDFFFKLANYKKLPTNYSKHSFHTGILGACFYKNRKVLNSNLCIKNSMKWL